MFSSEKLRVKGIHESLPKAWGFTFWRVQKIENKNFIKSWIERNSSIYFRPKPKARKSSFAENESKNEPEETPAEIPKNSNNFGGYKTLI